ncbi:20154_t:CDS:2 [Funneliformis geosporum]|nr:20154_t:CDS:2 [Funneliformis geosporum]
MHITFNIINALYNIHWEDAIHRDLHSGNILYLQSHDYWYISDLGFYGPADKPLKCIYGNLPYIAPEVIAGKGYTKASDVYSLAMLMWEISFGKSPFNENKNDYDLAMKIVNGMRPKITSDIPLEYKNLMEQCWNADPSQRPNIYAIYNNISGMNKLYYKSDEKKIDDIANLCDKTSKKIGLYKECSKKLSKISERLRINSNYKCEIFVKGKSDYKLTTYTLLFILTFNQFLRGISLKTRGMVINAKLKIAAGINYNKYK